MCRRFNRTELFRGCFVLTAVGVVVVALAGQAYALDTDDAFDRARARKEKGCLPAFGEKCSSIRTMLIQRSSKSG